MRPTALKTLPVVLGLVVAGQAMAQSAPRTTVVPDGMNISTTLSPGIRIGDMLYTSGQLPGRDSTIQGQTRQTLDKIKAVVEKGGSTMDQVVKCTVFLVDVKDFQGMNSVYSTYWPKDPPARSTVVVAALVVASAKLEIECIAAIPPAAGVPVRKPPTR